MIYWSTTLRCSAAGESVKLILSKRNYLKVLWFCVQGSEKHSESYSNLTKKFEIMQFQFRYYFSLSKDPFIQPRSGSLYHGGRLFLPSAWLGHSLIFYNFKTIHLKLIKFDENMVLWLVNQNYENNQLLMYHFSSSACLRKLNLNLREKKHWFSNACNFLRKTFSNLLKHELYFN